MYSMTMIENLTIHKQLKNITNPKKDKMKINLRSARSAKNYI